MDRIGLETLRQELLNDNKILLDAFSKAGNRMVLKSEVGYEGCAHHLCRLYNAVEQMALRIAKAFENHIDDEQGLAYRPPRSGLDPHRRHKARSNSQGAQEPSGRTQGISPRVRPRLRARA